MIALVFVSVFLLVLALGFMVLAILLWLQNELESRKLSGLKSKWQNPLFDWISDSKRKSAVPVLVSPDQVPYFVDYLLELTQRFHGSAMDALRLAAEPHLKIVAQSVSSRDPYTRAWAVRVLGIFGLPRYVNALRKGLRDSSPVIRMISFRSLILFGYLEYLDEMVSSLSGFSEWNQNFLASLLSTLGPQVADNLRQHFVSPQTPVQVKSVLAVALRQLNDAKSGPLAEKVLQKTSDRDLLISCLRLLRSSGTSEQSDAVRRLCLSNDFAVRAQAIRTLGSLGNSNDIPLLKRAMDEGNSWLSSHAAFSLKQIGALGVLEAAASSPGPQKIFALQALAEK